MIMGWKIHCLPVSFIFNIFTTLEMVFVVVVGACFLAGGGD